MAGQVVGRGGDRSDRVRVRDQLPDQVGDGRDSSRGIRHRRRRRIPGRGPIHTIGKIQEIQTGRIYTVSSNSQ